MAGTCQKPCKEVKRPVCKYAESASQGKPLTNLTVNELMTENIPNMSIEHTLYAGYTLKESSSENGRSQLLVLSFYCSTFGHFTDLSSMNIHLGSEIRRQIWCYIGTAPALVLPCLTWHRTSLLALREL